MTPIIQPAAEADLQAISDYISPDDPERALSFVDELIAQIQIVGERPLSFAVRDQWGPQIRSAVYNGYHILFEVDEQAVFVLRVLHGAQDIGSLLDESE